jgi:CBS domain-containing protein
MLVREILEHKGREVITIEPGATVEALADVLTRKNIGAALVTQGERILGVVSERDLVRCVAGHGQRALTMRVDEIMTTSLEVCGPEHSVDQVMSRMTVRRVRHVPVLEDRRLIGLISIGDVVKYRVEEIEAEAHMLHDYIEAR